MPASQPAIDLRDLPLRILPRHDAPAATRLSIAPFLALTRDLGALLVPMRPRPAFRAELHRSLIADARRQQAQAALDIAPHPVESTLGDGLPDRMAQLLALVPGGAERRWVVGAAVGGAVSLGFLAYLLRHHDRQAAA